jgi:hypothetical protein
MARLGDQLGLLAKQLDTVCDHAANAGDLVLSML